MPLACRGSFAPVETLRQQQLKAPHPVIDRRVINGDAALSHHLFLRCGNDRLSPAQPLLSNLLQTIWRYPVDLHEGRNLDAVQATQTRRVILASGQAIFNDGGRLDGALVGSISDESTDAATKASSRGTRRAQRSYHRER